jgi:cytoskeleton protein RodZ
MAPQIGKALREARTERGIELGEVERVTKIRIKFLRAMEEDRWEALPAPAYARGFLSTYARFLGLDDEALVDEYRRTVEGADRPEPIPHQVLQPATRRHRRRSIKPVAVLFAGLIAVVLLGLVIVGLLGGSDDSGDVSDQRGERAAGSADRTATTGETTAAPGGELPAGSASEVSLEVRSTGTVWVCLVDDDDRTPVNETLTADEQRGPFESRAFEVTFGNGSVEMTVDGEPAEVPPLAEPLGYRITPSGVRRLDPSSQPTCL